MSGKFASTDPVNPLFYYLARFFIAVIQLMPLKLVALAGRVPVKVDASFGAIHPGDALTPSSLPGVAMRASGPVPIIGTALDLLEGATTPRNTLTMPLVWSKGEAWKGAVFTAEQPFLSQEQVKNWEARKQRYRDQKAKP